jgi:uncharacterized membrane protein YsdA (DUF1294 family)
MIMFWIIPFGLALIVMFLQLNYFPIISPIITWLIAINCITCIVYGYDKAVAQLGQFRVPEKVLLSLAFAGGWPLGYISMRLLHHKTSNEKVGFRRIFWLLVVVEIITVVIALLVTQ